MTTANEHTLPKLPYAYDALEPHIITKIMEIHHSKHHQTYVNGLNAAEKAYAQASQSADVRKQIELQSALKFNGGGHINHSLYWKNLAPQKENGGKLKDGPLKEAIDRDFGGLEKLKESFNAKAAAIQGSGWAWLGYNQSNSRLELATTQNQDPLTTHAPIIAVDAWEHSWYLQWTNNKAEYFKAIWNVINFDEAEKRLQDAQKKAQL